MAHLSAVDHRPQVKTEESHNQTDLRLTVFNKQDRPYCTPLAPCFNVGPCEKPSDQFVIRRGNQFTLVLQNRPARPYRALPVFPIHTPLAQNVQWSPLGSYLLAISARDLLKIYGRGVGQGFLYVMRYYHPMVQQADFSPGDKYLVTYSKPQGSDPKSLYLKIFNVKTGIVIVGLERNQVADGESVKIRWSGGKDDKYFATLHQNTASVYEITETETFSMFGRFNDVLDLSWSPTDSILALLKADCKQKQKHPTKVVLLQIPSKEVLMEKDIGSDCEMYWQSEGKYLAVKVDEHILELFCFNEKGITNVCLKLEKILSFLVGAQR